MSEERSWKSKIFWWLVKSPVSVILFCSLVYFAFQAYVLNNQPVMNKLCMFGVLAVWGLWFVLRHMFGLLLILLLIGGGFYLYYAKDHKAETECENNGGYWNSNTKTCEEKVGVLEQIKKMWGDYKDKEQSK